MGNADHGLGGLDGITNAYQVHTPALRHNYSVFHSHKQANPFYAVRWVELTLSIQAREKIERGGPASTIQPERLDCKIWSCWFVQLVFPLCLCYTQAHRDKYSFSLHCCSDRRAQSHEQSRCYKA